MRLFPKERKGKRESRVTAVHIFVKEGVCMKKDFGYLKVIALAALIAFAFVFCEGAVGPMGPAGPHTDG